MSLAQPWLVDLSHLLLAMASASNLIIFTVQVLTAHTIMLLFSSQDIRFRSLLIADMKRVLFLYRQGNTPAQVVSQREDSMLVGENTVKEMEGKSDDRDICVSV